MSRQMTIKLFLGSGENGTAIRTQRKIKLGRDAPFVDLVLMHEIGHIMCSETEHNKFYSGFIENIFGNSRETIVNEAAAWRWAIHQRRKDGRTLSVKEKVFIRKCFDSYLRNRQ